MIKAGKRHHHVRTISFIRGDGLNANTVKLTNTLNCSPLWKRGVGGDFLNKSPSIPLYQRGKTPNHTALLTNSISLGKWKPAVGWGEVRTPTNISVNFNIGHHLFGFANKPNYCITPIVGWWWRQEPQQILSSIDILGIISWGSYLTPTYGPRWGNESRPSLNNYKVLRLISPERSLGSNESRKLCKFSASFRLFLIFSKNGLTIFSSSFHNLFGGVASISLPNLLDIHEVGQPLAAFLWFPPAYSWEKDRLKKYIQTLIY